MERQETTSFIPLISRFDRLDRVLHVLEEKQSLSKIDMCGDESKNECMSLSSALEEVQHKGTLLERLALLEKRVLKLSLEIDEGNTSKSSSSTVEVSETKKSGIGLSTIHDFATNEESASSADGFVREKTSKRHHKKKWLWLPRLGC